MTTRETDTIQIHTHQRWRWQRRELVNSLDSILSPNTFLADCVCVCVSCVRAMARIDRRAWIFGCWKLMHVCVCSQINQIMRATIAIPLESQQQHCSMGMNMKKDNEDNEMETSTTATMIMRIQCVSPITFSTVYVVMNVRSFWIHFLLFYRFVSYGVPFDQKEDE